MAKKYADETWLVICDGLYLETAVTCARDVGRVLYFVPWEHDSQLAHQFHLRVIGQGFPGVTRIEDYHRVLDEVDRIIVLTNYYGGLQWREEKRHRAKVWGSRLGEELELLREDTKAYMAGQGVTVGPWKSVIGTDALRSYIEKHPGCYVKHSKYRGIFESFCAENGTLADPWIRRIERALGPLSQDYPFICEDKIEDACEIALDSYTVNGQFPTRCLVGLESKNKGYVGHLVSEKYQPKQLLELNRKFAPTLKRYGYCGFFAPEARITKEDTYLLDPCCRQSSPCGEAMQAIYANLPQIIREATEGNCIDPVPPMEDGDPLLWVAELLLYSSLDMEEWCPVEFPDELRENVKLHNAVCKDGQYWVVPSTGPKRSLGAVVACGRSMDEATSRVKEIAEQVQASDLECSPECFDQIAKEIEKMPQYGLKM